MERCGTGGRIVILLIQFVMRNVGEVGRHCVSGGLRRGSGGGLIVGRVVWCVLCGIRQ